MTRPWLVIGEGISLAHVSRAAMIASALRDVGEDVVIATGPKYESWLSERGWHPRIIWTPNPSAVYDRLRRLRPMLTQEEVERCVKADLELFQQVDPHAVIGDCRNSLRISSRLAGLPYAAVTNANTTPWYAGPPELPIAACPPHRLRQSLDRRFPSAVRGLQNMGCERLARPFARAARVLGAETDCTDFRRVFTSDELTLLADDPEFSPTDSLPGHVRSIGPLYVERDSPNASATRDAIDALSRRCTVSNAPLLVLSTGSTGSARHLSAAIKAFLASGWQVATIGKDRPDVSHADVASLPFADPATLLPRAAAVICHGGNGSIYQALRYGVPVFSLPTFFDQQAQATLTGLRGLGGSLLGVPVKLWPERVAHSSVREQARATRVESPETASRIAANEILSKLGTTATIPRLAA